MKTKNKMVVLMEIAVVLCSMLLVAIPAIAAEQNQEMQKISTTASEDDFVLAIYGNANEDDTIDMRDVTYTKLVIFGKKPETELADAYFDGEVDVLDVVQIKLIILGRESELTVIDSADAEGGLPCGRIVTIKKPIKSVIPFSSYVTEVMRSLKVTDKIVGVPNYVTKEKVFFPEFSDFPDLGDVYEPDYEKIAELQPDVFFLFTHKGTTYDEVQDTVESLVPGVTVIRLSCAIPDIYIEEVTKLGYIFDRREEADEFIDFYEECLNLVCEEVETLSEDEKPRVFHTYACYIPGTYYTSNSESAFHQLIVAAGGINIAADLPATTVDPEWVIVEDPEIILGTEMDIGYGSYGYDVLTEAEMVARRDKIMKHPAWEDISAVKNDKVYLIFFKLVICTGEHFLGTAYMAKLFHPELFEDFDPREMHQEYLTRFQGLDLDVYDYAFVYPFHSSENMATAESTGTNSEMK